jgi:hypothetical protein
MPADGQALLNQTATARARLSGERRIDRDDSLTGACRLEGKDAQECRPARIGDALGEVVIPDHIADLQAFVIDRVVLTSQRQRGLVAKVLALTTRHLMRFRLKTG